MQPCSVVIETSDWRPEHRIQLWDTLDEVTRQAAAADAEVVLVLDATHAEHRAELATRYPRVRIVQGPEGDGYYANKHRGILEAHGELVVLTDANCMPQPGWLAAAIGTFNGRDPSVGVVQGRTFFDRAPLLRVWDAIWWARSTSPPGPVDRLYTGNNLALRRRTFHDYSSRLRDHFQRAYARGFSMLATRAAYPTGIHARTAPLRWIVPWVAFPLLVGKDGWRLVSRFRRAFGSSSGAWRLPGLLVIVVLVDLVSLAGMLRALRPGAAVEPP